MGYGKEAIMVKNTKFYFKRGHILFLMILLSGLVDFVSAEESFKKINENKIEAMIERAQPLIEMITGRQFTEKITFELVKREVVRDVLDEELLPIYKIFEIFIHDFKNLYLGLNIIRDNIKSLCYGRIFS